MARYCIVNNDKYFFCFSHLLFYFRATILGDNTVAIRHQVDRIHNFSPKVDKKFNSHGLTSPTNPASPQQLYTQAIKIFTEQFIERKFSAVALNVFAEIEDICHQVVKEETANSSGLTFNVTNCRHKQLFLRLFPKPKMLF